MRCREVPRNRLNRRQALQNMRPLISPAQMAMPSSCAPYTLPVAAMAQIAAKRKGKQKALPRVRNMGRAKEKKSFGVNSPANAQRAKIQDKMQRITGSQFMAS